MRARDAHTLPDRYGLTGPEARDPRRLLEELLHHVWHGLRPGQHKAILAGEGGDPDIEALMSTSLWQYAGTRPNPASGSTKRRISQARAPQGPGCPGRSRGQSWAAVVSRRPEGTARGAALPLPTAATNCSSSPVPRSLPPQGIVR
ncbi:hypothetical protein GCM10010384_11560 [Streptomyces djakartensis]|uniref:Uncharacterized protein n=1 Tax=Streptomyces djakartensis TaxID=68193 RepID=A0ABQ2ZBJ1_9ACTN|nr:hypothetical protein GCM10010384_11560 [Streptomyces djakartensis]